MIKKGYTIAEIMVVVVIILTVFSLGVAIYKGSSTDFDDNTWLVSPEIQNMKSQRQIAEELRRQNDLRERELNMREQPER
jgi:prepilin-type N-terminal cleavage/methylation domain-containing protein